MTVRVGVDLVDEADLRGRMERSAGLCARLFAPQEIRTCRARVNPYQHFAARLAAKEALLKAFGLGLLAGIPLTDIVVRNDARGAPRFELTGRAAARLLPRGARLSLSLSHTGGMAVAVVAVEPARRTPRRSSTLSPAFGGRAGRRRRSP